MSVDAYLRDMEIDVFLAECYEDIFHNVAIEPFSIDLHFRITDICSAFMAADKVIYLLLAGEVFDVGKIHSYILGAAYDYLICFHF